MLTVMGDTHLAIVLERLKRKYSVEVDVEERRHSYRQTIAKPASAEGRHKKQTGGHGQFAVVHLRIEPLERGAGFAFVDQVVGGAIPRQFIPAVEKGVARAMRQGGVFGFPVVDVRATCLDGRFHPVDSSEASFETAGAPGQQALTAAGEFVRYQSGDQVDGGHGVGLCLEQACFQHCDHASHAQFVQGAIEFDQVHGLDSSNWIRCWIT